MREMEVRQLGEVAHAAADALMRQLQAQRIGGEIGDVLLLCSHPEIVTIGRRSVVDDIVVPPDYAAAPVDRGGGLTWHGPGQLVAYPVVRWDLAGEQHVGRIIERLEAWIIASLAELGLIGSRDPRMQGVWMEGRKVCSIGLAFLKWVSRHGLTINRSTPPGRVEGLAGCGLDIGLNSSIEHSTGRLISQEELIGALLAVAPGTLGRHPGLAA